MKSRKFPNLVPISALIKLVLCAPNYEQNRDMHSPNAVNKMHTFAIPRIEGHACEYPSTY
ncbi:hypothetical protein VAE122_2910435 [Vibrio aestuarianus]|nr:hypothetical protein VAE122_2910435 [Vibrio aestuarianus]